MKTMIGPPQKIMIKKRTSRTRSMTNGQELRADNNSAPRELLCLTWTMTWRSSLKTQALQLLVTQRIPIFSSILLPTTRISQSLTLLIILLPKINFLVMLSSVYRLGRRLKRRLRTPLKRPSSNLKMVMTLTTLFLIVFEETILLIDQVWIKHLILNWKQVKFLLWISHWLEDNYQVKRSQQFCKLFRLIKWLFSN